MLWVLLPFVVVVIVVFALQPPGAAMRQQQRRLAAIERKLDLVMDHLGVTEPAPAMPDVVRALERGAKITAVKAYRDATGAGLSEAKRAVDAMAEQRGL
jgi:ribosomal protein L7/L12